MKVKYQFYGDSRLYTKFRYPSKYCISMQLDLDITKLCTIPDRKTFKSIMGE